MSMRPALLALLGFAGWTLLLVFVVAAWRVTQVLTGRLPASAFPQDAPHGPGWYRRVHRAHLNCCENLPIFGAIVLAGTVAPAPAGLFDTLALVSLGGRLLQSGAHAASGGSLAVNVRFTGFLTQLLCWSAMLVLLLARGE